MKFDEFLISRKIDAEAFQNGDPDLYKKWNFSFEQMHPASFTTRYLFNLNSIRRKFTLKKIENTSPSSTSPSASSGKTRPVIRPKIN